MRNYFLPIPKPESRKFINRLVPLALLLLLGKALAVAQEPAKSEPQLAIPAFKLLEPGVEYANDVRAQGPLSIHVLRLDRLDHQWDIQTGLGQGTIYGLEPLTGIIDRTTTALKKPATAAINGDFFVINADPYQGDPRGLQLAAGELVSAPTGNCFWVSAEGELKIGPVESKLRAIWPDGKTETPFGLNEARGDDALVLYTPALGIRPGETTAQPPGTRAQGGREIVLERIEGQAWLPITIGKTYLARVQEVRQSGNTSLTPGQMILSIGPRQEVKVPQVMQGNVMQLVLETKPDLGGVRTAIGAGKILIQDGKTTELGPADQPRHPRSLIGWNRQHIWLMVIDGRQPRLSMGMTYPEMAELARQYGCTDAIELDGGGSSTLWVLGNILNSPSEGRQRAVANGLIFFRK
jgi:hypothetical protein